MSLSFLLPTRLQSEPAGPDFKIVPKQSNPIGSGDR